MATSLLSPSKRQLRQEADAQHFPGSGCKHRAKCSLWIVEVDSHKSAVKSDKVLQELVLQGIFYNSNKGKILAVGQSRNRHEVSGCAALCELFLPGDKRESLQVRMSCRHSGSPPGSSACYSFAICLSPVTPHQPRWSGSLHRDGPTVTVETDASRPLTFSPRLQQQRRAWEPAVFLSATVVSPGRAEIKSGLRSPRASPPPAPMILILCTFFQRKLQR